MGARSTERETSTRACDTMVTEPMEFRVLGAQCSMAAKVLIERTRRAVHRFQERMDEFAEMQASNPADVVIYSH